MRSRLAILGMLIVGMVLTTGGAGLAASGFASGKKNAATSQYGAPSGGAKPGTDVLGENGSGGPAGQQEESQPAAQVEAGAQGSGQLPFTGFAAIPVLLGGVALLATGLVLRRRTSEDA